MLQLLTEKMDKLTPPTNRTISGVNISVPEFGTMPQGWTQASSFALGGNSPTKVAGNFSPTMYPQHQGTWYIFHNSSHHQQGGIHPQQFGLQHYSMVPPTVTVSGAVFNPPSSSSGGNYVFPTRMTKLDFPKFEGDEVRPWLYRCERFFKLDQTPDASKVLVASVALEGRALQWYQTFEQVMNKFNLPLDWTKFSTAIIHRFGKVYENEDEIVQGALAMSEVQEWKDEYRFKYSSRDTKVITSSSGSPVKVALTNQTMEKNEDHVESPALATEEEKIQDSYTYEGFLMVPNMEVVEEFLTKDDSFGLLALSAKYSNDHLIKDCNNMECIRNTIPGHEENATNHFQDANDVQDIEVPHWTLTRRPAKQMLVHSYNANHFHKEELRWQENTGITIPQDAVNVLFDNDDTLPGSYGDQFPISNGIRSFSISMSECDNPFKSNINLVIMPEFTTYCTQTCSCKQVSCLRRRPYHGLPLFSQWMNSNPQEETITTSYKIITKPVEPPSTREVQRIKERLLIFIWGWYYKDSGRVYKISVGDQGDLNVKSSQHVDHPGNWLKAWKIAWQRFNQHPGSWLKAWKIAWQRSMEYPTFTSTRASYTPRISDN